MIEGHIGPAHYRQGVQTYLKRHQYACTQSRDLWQAFEDVSEQPISAMMQSWISQPGYPVVHVSRAHNSLQLRQERFTYLPSANQQTWLLPISLTLWDAQGRSQHQTHLLAESATAINLPANAAAYKLNSSQNGFYRVAYEDQHNLETLGGMLADQKMAVADRWGLQNDLYALVRQTSRPFGAYLDFLKYYANECDYLPLTSIADHLLQTLLIAPQSWRAPIAAIGRQLSERVLARCGYTPATAEAQTISLLRDQLLWQAVLWGSTDVSAFGAEQFQQMTAGAKVHADIAKSVLQIGACCGSAQALGWLCDRLRQSTSEYERMNILIALGAFQQWAVQEEALAYALVKVPPRNRFIPIVAAAANPAHQEHLWDWYRQHLPQLEALHPVLFERTITAVWPYAGLGRQEELENFAQEYSKAKPDLTDAIKLALENLTINSRLRTHLAAEDCKL